MQCGKALTAKQHSPLEANSVLYHFIVPDLDCPVVFYSIFVSKGHLPQKKGTCLNRILAFLRLPPHMHCLGKSAVCLSNDLSNL